MPDFLNRFLDRASRKDTAPVNSYEGFQSNGAVVLRYRRGASKAEIPDVDLKSEGFGSDPLAIYKPTGAKAVSPAKAMANFNGWTFAAVNAIASEVANIQLPLYRVTSDNHEKQDDHPVITLLDGLMSDRDQGQVFALVVPSTRIARKSSTLVSVGPVTTRSPRAAKTE